MYLPPSPSFISIEYMNRGGAGGHARRQKKAWKRYQEGLYIIAFD